MANKSANVCTINEDGILALAFACLGQDAGIPGKPYIRIFPTSVEQCFGVLHGKNLPCNDPILDEMRAGTTSINAMFRDADAPDEVEEEDSDDDKADDDKNSAKRDSAYGELGFIKSSKSIRQFVSTLLPIDVVDKIYNSMAKDKRDMRQAEREARAFSARIGSKNDSMPVDLEEGQISLLA